MNAPAHAFAATRWTLVLRARGDTPESRAALAELCETYWNPVFSFLRREGRAEDDARELTQEFFARLLAREEFEAVEPSRGRFRSYLLGAVKHFLSDQRDRQRTQKRGGGEPTESLDAAGDDTGPQSIVAPQATLVAAPPDAWFDREWGLTVMARAINLVAADYTASGKHTQFEQLKGWLVGDTPALSQAEAAARLGLTEGAVKVAIHRLRQRFRQAVRSEIAQTLAEGDDIDAELRYLVEVLSAD